MSVTSVTHGDAAKKVDSSGHAKVECLECGMYFHRLDVHLAARHKLNVDAYLAKYPGAETISEAAKARAAEAQMRRNGKTKAKATAEAIVAGVQIADRAGKAPSTEKSQFYRIGVAKLEHVTGLSREEQAFVPRHDDNWSIGERERDQWEALALGIEEGENVLMVGPTGCGKSTSVLELAAAINQPVRRVNLHGDIRAADFIGEKVVDVDPETEQAVVVWRDGILPQAMRAGHWVLLDELDSAPPAILFVLQSVLEPGGRLVLPGNGGEVVIPHPRFRIIATANTLGRGDDSGMYAGTNILNEAFLDRFGVVIECGYPDEETEIRIVKAKSGLDDANVRKMVRVARAIREANEREEVFCTFSTRRLLSWASKARRFGNPIKAARYAVLNKLTGDDRDVVRGVIQRYFGGAV